MPLQPAGYGLRQQIRRADDGRALLSRLLPAHRRSAQRRKELQHHNGHGHDDGCPARRGHRREPDPEGALAGAAIGAGAGAGASYLVAKYNNERDDRVRLASYARDLNADVNSLNRVTAAGQVAYNCYSAKFRAALEDYKAKRITRAELDQRYAEIKSGLAEASAILGSTLSEADKREAEYRQVLTIEAKKASRPIPPVQTVATTSKKTSKATKTVTRKQTSDQLQNLSNGVGSYKESTAQLTAVKSDLDEIQLQMDKVMLAQG